MGNVAPDFKDKLLSTINSLPKNKQAEVLDFAGFLRARLELPANIPESIPEDKLNVSQLTCDIVELDKQIAEKEAKLKGLKKGLS